jgi:hypothetical protein
MAGWVENQINSELMILLPLQNVGAKEVQRRCDALISPALGIPQKIAIRSQIAHSFGG